MSRTDKTRPFWVKLEDPYNRRCVEERHDHRSTECDFDGTSGHYCRGAIPGPRAEQAEAFWAKARHQCVIDAKLGYGGSGELMARTCGSWCSVCGPGMKFEGVVRAKLRQLKRKMIKTHVEDLDDLDEITTDHRAVLFTRGQHR